MRNTSKAAINNHLIIIFFSGQKNSIKWKRRCFLFIMRIYAIVVHTLWCVVLHRPIFNRLDEVRHWLADQDEDVLAPWSLICSSTLPARQELKWSAKDCLFEARNRPFKPLQDDHQPIATSDGNGKTTSRCLFHHLAQYFRPQKVAAAQGGGGGYRRDWLGQW